MTLNTKLGIIAGTLVAGAGFVWIAILVVLSQSHVVTQTTQNNLIIEPTTVDTTAPIDAAPALVARQLDGVLVPTTEASHYPIAVMIENAAFDGVRPQFGLSSAQVIYEVIVEGGITRLMALFSGTLPDKVGPVRSSRPTFLEFSSEYNAIYGHAGGSPEAMQAISGLDIVDLSALAADSEFFTRDPSRVAPHNLFTTGTMLQQALTDKGFDTKAATFDSWLFKDDQPIVDATPTAHNLAIDFGSGPLYAVNFLYDPLTNSYQRYDGGELQHDAVNNQTLTAKNVIVEMVPAAIPAGEDGRVNFSVTGSGNVFIARDGQVVTGTWKKADRTSRTKWYDATGAEIALDRGTTWIELLPVTGNVTYQ